MKFIYSLPLFAAGILILSSCNNVKTIDVPSAANADSTSIACAYWESSFTGRSNIDEPLAYIDVTPKEALRIKNVTVTINAEPGSITAVHLTDGKEILRTNEAGRDTCSIYSFNYHKDITAPTRLIISVDIASSAREGAKVYAKDIKLRTTSSNKELTNDSLPILSATACDTEAAREILLVRRCVYRPGDYGSKNYRIPAILTLPDGSLLVANDKRKFNEWDLPEDIDIIASNSTDNGLTWSKPVTVAEGKGVKKGYGDPALVLTKEGNVICAFVGGPGLNGSTLEEPQCSYITRSKDGGKTWDPLLNVTEMLWGPRAVNSECRQATAAFFGSGNGLRLTKGEKAGRIMFVTAILKNKKFGNYVVYSDDSGETWHISKKAYDGGDEAKVVELNDGRILMSVRQNGERGWNISEDGGEIWGEQSTWKEIKTNACNSDIIRYDDNTLLLSIPNDMKRRNVSIFVSNDEGKTWPYVKSICPYQSVYSSLTIRPDHTIGAYVEENPNGAVEMWYINFSFDWLMNKQ